MLVHVRYVGTVRKDVNIDWPEGWSIPRVGDEITIPKLPEVSHVRTVVWYPEGDEEANEPFVYVVVGPRNVVD
jgi:hypothetical protein